MSDFQRKSSMENYRSESALKVMRKEKHGKDALKASLKDFSCSIGSWNRLHRSDQSVEVSSTKEQLSMKRRESLKLKESA